MKLQQDAKVIDKLQLSNILEGIKNGNELMLEELDLTIASERAL